MSKTILKITSTTLASSHAIIITAAFWFAARFVIENKYPGIFDYVLFGCFAISCIARYWKVASKVAHCKTEKMTIGKTSYQGLKLFTCAMLAVVFSIIRSELIEIDLLSTVSAILDFAAILFTSKYTADTLMYILFQELIAYEPTIVKEQC